MCSAISKLVFMAESSSAKAFVGTKSDKQKPDSWPLLPRHCPSSAPIDTARNVYSIRTQKKTAKKQSRAVSKAGRLSQTLDGLNAVYTLRAWGSEAPAKLPSLPLGRGGEKRFKNEKFCLIKLQLARLFHLTSNAIFDNICFHVYNSCICNTRL